MKKITFLLATCLTVFSCTTKRGVQLIDATAFQTGLVVRAGCRRMRPRNLPYAVAQGLAGDV